MQQSNFMILGGEMMAGYAAKQLVELGLKPGELAILSSDDSIHLADDAIDRMMRLRSVARYPKQWPRDRVIEHKQYVAR